MSHAIQNLQKAGRDPHAGIFIVGSGKLELIEEPLPESELGGDSILTASLGYSRCTSDDKAIQLFHDHVRIPDRAEHIALGHETVQVVLRSNDTAGVQPGDIVVLTPGHSTIPVDPKTFDPDSSSGVLAALGYSYRYFGALRQINAIPSRAVSFVAAQGFGDLFNRVAPHTTVSLASLSHAEPYACCAGANRNIFFRSPGGEFSYDIPPRATLTYLGGTARMAMINLTIVAGVTDDRLPRVVNITGSQAKLDQLTGFSLIRSLGDRGVQINLIDRTDPHVVARSIEAGPSDVVSTNYASQDVYDQAVAIVAPGGNINNYAGATDPGIGFHMSIPAACSDATNHESAAIQFERMHHNLGPNDYRRRGGLQPGGTAAFFGFEGYDDALHAYLELLAPGQRVWIAGAGGTHPDTTARNFPNLSWAEDEATYDDVFIYATGDSATRIYASVEDRLNRSAAVNFVRGETDVFIKSRNIHYTTRHQICGTTIPYTMTNTSEPVSSDLGRQASDPIDFDWLIRGVSGLDHAIEMIEDVRARKPLGSYFSFVQIRDFPYVDVSETAFRESAVNGRCSDEARQALQSAADELKRNGDVWSRRIEEIIHEAYGLPYPLTS